MASLHARSPLRSAHLLLFLNKLVSLTALMVLLAAGWMAVSYLRAELADQRHGRPAGNELSSSPRPASLEKSEATGAELKPPLRLVYWCGGEAEFYHTQAHLPSNCGRTGLSEEAAARRGLKRCLVCLPQ
ncbi:MAG: hypothetical protein WAU45_06710 [Blastocatellia bacterium]